MTLKKLIYRIFDEDPTSEKKVALYRKKSIILLFTLIALLIHSVSRMLNYGIHYPVIIPYIGSCRSFTSTFISLVGIYAFCTIKVKHDYERIPITIFLMLIGLFTFEGIYNMILSLREGVLGVIPHSIIYLSSVIVMVFFYNKAYQIVDMSNLKWTIFLFIAMMCSMLYLLFGNFYDAFMLFNKGLGEDPHMLENYGVMWMIAKALGCVMWMPLAKRKKGL